MFNSLHSDPGSENVGARQRMAAVAAGLWRRKVAVEMGEQRPWNMCLAILIFAEGWLGQIVPAIEHAPLRMRGELGGADDRAWHQSIFNKIALTPFISRACGGATRGSAPRRLPSATGKGRRRPGPARRARGGRRRGARKSRCPRSRFPRTPPVARG